jgi:two-component system NarL family sensor kinase
VTRLDSRLFHSALAFALVYSLLALLAVLTGRWHSQLWPLVATLDLVTLAVLTYASGGPHSELRLAFILVPVTAALVGRPRHAVIALIAFFAAYAAACLAYVAMVGHSTYTHAAAEIVEAGVTSALVAILAVVLVQRNARSRRLVAELLSAEERERQRLAEALHDVPLQNLFAALSGLRHSGPSEELEVPEALLEGTIELLRGFTAELYPRVLDHAGLKPALEALVVEKQRHGDVKIEVVAAEGLRPDWDRLLFSLSRELLTNVIKHADGQRAWVRVIDGADALVLEVEDDGVGLNPGNRELARRTGHIGLAAMEDRLAALDGSLAVTTPPSGVGTLVHAVLPLKRAHDHDSQADPPAVARADGRRRLAAHTGSAV